MKKYLFLVLFPVFSTIAKCLLHSPYYVTNYFFGMEVSVQHTYTSVLGLWVNKIVSDIVPDSQSVYRLDTTQFIVETVITFVIATALAFLIRFIWNLLRARKGD